jgi:hypothetical protein
MRFRLVCALLALFVVSLATTGLAYGQGSFTSTLSGTVVDTSGAVIPGADVKVKNNGTGAEFNAVSSANGTFAIPSMLPGNYSVTVSLMGFKTAVLSAVTINAATPASVRVTLDVGSLEESVSVVAESASIVQTQTPAVATTMTANQISNLPLTSRNALDSITSLAGFNTAGGARDSTVSGLPQSAINITLDGMSVQDNYLKTSDGFFARLSPRLDAVEEVTVTTAGNTVDATGQGAAQIRFVTRSGSNALKGSVYEYYRNDKLNANTFFNLRDLRDPVTGVAAKAELRQHQPGFRVGGPILRNKAFFFVNYEQFRQPSKITRNRNILNPAAEAGIFTYTASGQQRQVNLLQLAAANSQLSTPDPIVAKLLADIRSATKTTGSLTDLPTSPLLQQYTFQLQTQSLNHYPTVRIDYNLSENHRLVGSMNYQHINSNPDTTNSREPVFPGFPVTGSQQSTRWTTSESMRSTFGSSVVNEFRVGSTGGATFFSPELGASMWKGTSIGDQGGYNISFAACCGTGNVLANVGTAATPSSREASTKVIDDTLSWVKGTHSLTFGGAMTQGDLWLKNQMLVPSVGFGLITGDPAIGLFTTANFPGASTTDTTNARALYAILTGKVNSVTGDARLTPAADKYVYLGEGLAQARLREFDFFAGDTWRVRSNLTLSYGLRYALQNPFYPRNNAYTTATLDSLWGVSGVGNLFQPGVKTTTKPGFVQFPEGTYAYKADRNNFAPSAGFAWSTGERTGLLGRILGNADDSVIRGGFAVAYERHGMSDFSDVFGTNPGLRITGITDRSDTLGNLAAGTLLRNPAQIAAPAFNTTPVYPIVPSITNSVNIFDSNLQVPYSQSWTIGWQRKLGQNTAFEARYVGSRHRQNWVSKNINEINVVENGFLSEFRKAQANLQANIAAGRGNTFAYTGAPGTSPLPIILAYFQGLGSSQASDPTKYTSASFSDSQFYNTLATFNPMPCCGAAGTNLSFAYNLINNAGRRTNAITAGLAPNFFVANPDVLGAPAGANGLGANYITNGGGNRYSSIQLELRKRLSGGLQFNANYTFGRAYELNPFGFRKPEEETLQTGTVGGVTHSLKGNWVYDLPFGRDHKWANNLGPVMERIVGGWHFDGVARIQTGQLLDFGNVRLVGMSVDDFRKSFNLRTAPDGQLYLLPQDIIDNTVAAFNVSATSPTGYAGAAPKGRYLAPANGPDCIEVTPGYGDCGLRNLVVTGPKLVRFDLSAVKRTALVGGATFEFRAEMLNAFNKPYFTPVTGFTQTQLSGGGFEGENGIPLINAVTTSANNFRLTSLLGDNTARIVQLVARVTW